MVVQSSIACLSYAQHGDDGLPRGTSVWTRPGIGSRPRLDSRLLPKFPPLAGLNRGAAASGACQGDPGIFIEPIVRGYPHFFPLFWGLLPPPDSLPTTMPGKGIYDAGRGGFSADLVVVLCVFLNLGYLPRWGDAVRFSLPPRIPACHLVCDLSPGLFHVKLNLGCGGRC